MTEQTLILIKPDGLKKSLTGNILSKLSELKFEIIGTKIVRVSESLARKHYKDLVDKPFFPDLLKYILGEFHTRRVMALVYSGEGCIKSVRKLAGATNPEEADPVSIRGAYGRVTTYGVFENVIHCSSCPEDAKREIQLWFEPDELVDELYPVQTVAVQKPQKRVWA